MADTAADHDVLITQFCTLTGTAPHEVSVLVSAVVYRTLWQGIPLC